MNKKRTVTSPSSLSNTLFALLARSNWRKQVFHFFLEYKISLTYKPSSSKKRKIADIFVLLNSKQFTDKSRWSSVRVPVQPLLQRVVMRPLRYLQENKNDQITPCSTVKLIIRQGEVDCTKKCSLKDKLESRHNIIRIDCVFDWA